MKTYKELIGKTTVGAVVFNDLGEFLLHTCRPTIQACIEDAKEYFTEETWNRMKEFGCQVVPIEIKIMDCNPDIVKKFNNET